MAHFRLQKSLLALSIGLALVAQAQAAVPGQSEAIARLSADTGYTAQVAIHAATGSARFVRAGAGGKLAAAPVVRSGVTDAARQANAVQFLNNYAGLFGISNASTELVTTRTTRDSLGHTHISHQQVYQGVPVFGAELKSHFDAAGNLTVVNGAFVPGISLSTSPARSATQAASAALTYVKAGLERQPAIAPTAQTPTLVVYREGLAKGVEGANHLAWQVEVTNRADVRDTVFVDAQSGKVIDKIAGIHDAKSRRAFDGAGAAAAPGPNYPSSPLWVEGQAFPTGTTEADNMILASSEIYDLFKKAFGRDSYDANGATMDSIFNRGWGCVNASWNGTYISFCPGTTTDDITAHEWGHAYTEYTHKLIYAWQPGALNEAYSDIWGETVDRINGRGLDTPDAPRTVGACTVFTPNPPTTNITAPAAIAGPLSSGSASFGPTTFSLSGNVVGVDVGSTSAGCTTPFTNAAAVVGKIAFIDRGTCGFAVKAKNAQLNGAIGVIIGNNAAGAAPGLGGTDATVTIPTLSVSQVDGTAIKNQLAITTVSATLTRGGNGTDNSVRWLLGEESSAFGGAIRDMYNPGCYSNPGKVSDANYTCATSDNGGVHGNSGVPNHGYALLVDGGTYNGQSINGIGLTKAAHIYYRAQSVYQGPTSGFPDHADALAQSCADLTGTNLLGLTTGTPSGQVITAADCGDVAKMALAVELRSPPTQCNFAPLLAQSPPALCTTGTVNMLASDSFDSGRAGSLRWTLSNTAVTTDFKPRDWGVVSGMPGGRPGYGIFVPDADIGSCSVGSDASSSQRLDTPAITIPAGTTAPRLAFDHYVATEASYDGGNVKISVNGGAWTLVQAADFIYNGYNSTLATAAAGNTNPLAGQAAFTGSDGGSVSGTWGRSIVNLAPYAVAGDTIKLRFEFGKDGCGGVTGWYLDDVKIYRCTP